MPSLKSLIVDQYGTHSISDLTLARTSQLLDQNIIICTSSCYSSLHIVLQWWMHTRVLMN